MSDPLSMLRQSNIRNEEVIQDGDKIVFGDVSWPKNVTTNFYSLRSSNDGFQKDYYTLESVLFFLKNAKLFHTEYARKAEEKNIPVVEEAIKTDLLAYLNGEVKSFKNIDCWVSSIRGMVEVSLPMMRKDLDAQLLPDCIPHFGETIVNDIKEEENPVPQLGETSVHDVKENFFQLRYGETIVNDCKEEVDSFGPTATKRLCMQPCHGIKTEPSKPFVPEEKIRIETGLCCDVKEEFGDAV